MSLSRSLSLLMGLACAEALFAQPAPTSILPQDPTSKLDIRLEDIKSFPSPDHGVLDSQWKSSLGGKGGLVGVQPEWLGTFRAIDRTQDFAYMRLVPGSGLLFGNWDQKANQIRWFQQGPLDFKSLGGGQGNFKISTIDAGLDSSTSYEVWSGIYKVSRAGGSPLRMDLTGSKQGFGCFTGANPPSVPFHMVFIKVQ